MKTKYVLPFILVIVDTLVTVFKTQITVFQEMDAVMYRFREFTSLGRMNSDRVGFMSCTFSMNVQQEYEKLMSNKKEHLWDTQLLAYANGELPCHGRMNKKLVTDFDRIYAPVNLGDTHWILICVNFQLRTVEVFDCYGKIDGKMTLLKSYKVVNVPMPSGLNKSHCDCGVYAVKHIECHLLNLPFDLINDDNIHEARHRLAIDLWEAASDPVLIERMKLFEPPQPSDEIVNLD